jgi:predicted Zn-dependent peptidase
MLNLLQIAGPHGVPVYYQHIPNAPIISLRWIMFVGSNDDGVIGLPGLYHWFEHVPFQGTKRFPNGYDDTFGLITAAGGMLNAGTSNDFTVFEVDVSHKDWRLAFDLLTDLVAEPLLEKAGIEAERAIVCEEWAQGQSNPGIVGYERIKAFLWPDHPCGHPIIGYRESLDEMMSEHLYAAQIAGYCRRRLVLVIVGPLSYAEMLPTLTECIERIPDRGLAERRQPACYGPMPAWPAGQKLSFDFPFTTSFAGISFPCQPRAGLEQYARQCILDGMLGTPMIGPLERILRRERQLVYSASATVSCGPDGGFVGLGAATSPANTEAVIDALWDVIRHPSLSSQTWLETIKRIECRRVTNKIPYPASYASDAVGRLVCSGIVYSDQAILDAIENVTLEDIARELTKFTPERAVTFRFNGTVNGQTSS